MARTMRFHHFLQKRYRRMDRRTDTPSYRDARTHLKSVFDAFHRSALAEDTVTSRNVIEIAYSRSSYIL